MTEAQVILLFEKLDLMVYCLGVITFCAVSNWIYKRT